MNLTRCAFIFACVFLALVGDTAAAVPAAYTMTDLGAPSGTYVVPQAINARGQVTGSSPFAFIWENGTMRDLRELGTLGGNGSQASAINRNGVVAGGSATSTIGIFGVQENHAVIWDAAGIHDLGTLGGPSSGGQGINDLGQVVGAYMIADWPYTQRAFLWDSTGGMRPLDSLEVGGASDAIAINNSGLIVGGAMPADNRGPWRACFWADDGIHALDLLPGYSDSLAQAVNDSGFIVGQSYVGGGDYAPRATLWDQNGAHDLGTLGGSKSIAFGINSLGQIVGTSETPVLPYFSDAFLYEAGVMYNLNDLIVGSAGWRFQEAYGINDSGQIIGLGINGQEAARGFLLTPVPEPSSLLALLSGLMGISGSIWRKRR